MLYIFLTCGINVFSTPILVISVISNELIKSVKFINWTLCLRHFWFLASLLILSRLLKTWYRSNFFVEFRSISYFKILINLAIWLLFLVDFSSSPKLKIIMEILYSDDSIIKSKKSVKSVTGENTINIATTYVRLWLSLRLSY